MASALCMHVEGGVSCVSFIHDPFTRPSCHLFMGASVFVLFRFSWLLSRLRYTGIMARDHKQGATARICQTL